jgi:hypothetical protein
VLQDQAERVREASRGNQSSEVTIMKQAKPRPSGKSVPLAELAEEQGVTPVADLWEIAKLWPVDDDPAQLLEFILNERRARRNVRRKRR